MARQKASIIAIGGVVYRHNEQGQIEILLIRKREGYWTLPKGKVEPEESHTAAVEREIYEETGITGNVQGPVRKVSYTIIKKGKRYQKNVTYYLMQANDGEVRPSVDEGIEEIGWFSIPSALEHIGRNRVRKVARKASSLLQEEQKNEPNQSLTFAL